MGHDAMAAIKEHLGRTNVITPMHGSEVNGGGHMYKVVNAFVAAAALIGGSAFGADTQVTFQLNWMAGGPNAGFAAPYTLLESATVTVNAAWLTVSVPATYVNV